MPEAFSYALSIYDNEELVLRTILKEESSVTVSPSNNVIMWVHVGEQSHAYLFFFNDEGDTVTNMKELGTGVSRALYEIKSSNKFKFEERVAQDDENWIADAYMDYGSDDGTE